MLLHGYIAHRPIHSNALSFWQLAEEWEISLSVAAEYLQVEAGH